MNWPVRRAESMVQTPMAASGAGARPDAPEQRRRTERIVAEELRRHWRKADLGRRAKGDAATVATAARLRAETVLLVKWIAERLRLGAAGHASRLLQRHRKQNPTRSRTRL